MSDTKEKVTDKRRRLTGTVVSDKMDKTIVVRVDRVFPHPKFKKVVRRSKKYHAHDEKNECKTGDFIEIRETRPLSKQKRFTLVRIIKSAEVVETPSGKETVVA
jgi:small subunit ribosomal protein S17